MLELTQILLSSATYCGNFNLINDTQQGEGLRQPFQDLL